MKYLDIDTIFTPLHIVILIGLGLATLVILRFYFLHYRCLYKNQNAQVYPNKAGNEKTEQSISIILSGKNQYENLVKNLHFWLDQLYNKFEVVVVYDNADEELHLLLSNLEGRYPILKLVHINQDINFFDEEKFALSIGIKSAQYKHVFLTTAECRPSNEHCIKLLASTLNDKTEVLAGHCIYSNEHSSAFARYFYDEISLQTLGFILSGKAYATSHQALTYDRSIFLGNKGYTKYYALNTGPFDIFCKNLSSKEGAQIAGDLRNVLKVEAPLSFPKWIRLQQQYLNTYTKQSSKARHECITYQIAMVLFHLSAIGGLLYTFFDISSNMASDMAWAWTRSLWLYIFIATYLIKTITQLHIFFNAHKKLGEKKLWWRGPFLELGFMILLPILWAGKKRNIL